MYGVRVFDHDRLIVPVGMPQVVDVELFIIMGGLGTLLIVTFAEAEEVQPAAFITEKV